MTSTTGFKIESDFDLKSDWLTDQAFKRIYFDFSSAVATAIEGVYDPAEQEVRVIDIATGVVVWQSTDEEYE